MKSRIAALTFVGALAVSQAAFAQAVSGEVTKIDASQSKMTVKHGPITHLDMDSMTMVFRVQDPAMLKKVKPGDRIRFDVDRVNGQLTITRLVKR